MPARIRRHELLPHTADAGFRAHAQTIAGLFEEAALSLAALTVEIDTGLVPSRWETVSLESDDLVRLAYAWLNELVGLAEIHRAAVVGAKVEAVERTGADPELWSLRARVGLGDLGEGIRIVRQVKSATYHGLRVDHRRGRWTMEAYLDL